MIGTFQPAVSARVVVTPFGGQSGVMTDVPEGETWLYSPAQPAGQVKRMIIGMQRLPELLQRVSKLEKKSEGNADAV